MKYTLASLIALANCVAAATFTSPLESDQFYNVEFEERFQGTTLNRANWIVANDCWGGGNFEAQCYVDREGETFRIDPQDGLTIKPIVAQGDGTAALGGKPCTEAAADLPPEVIAPRCGPNFESPGLLWSAKLRSKFGVSPVLADGRQARVEIVARIPEPVNSVHEWPFPALWLLPFSRTSNPMQYSDWPLRGEIDIIEAIKHDGQVSSATHFAVSLDANNRPVRSLLGGDTAARFVDRKGFQLFAITWSGFDLVYSVDEQVIGRHSMKDLGISQQFFFQPGDWNVIINYAIQNGKGPLAVEAIERSTPFQIKSIRVLREKTPSMTMSIPPRTTINNRDLNRWNACVARNGTPIALTPAQGRCSAGVKVDLL
ncbi:hypothetical protein HK102_010463 [Quaeritorhiza haematococci]|nr:hypothetical protein HK102_010463 [Quaeritorhiza haematococci]